MVECLSPVQIPSRVITLLVMYNYLPVSEPGCIMECSWACPSLIGMSRMTEYCWIRSFPGRWNKQWHSEYRKVHVNPSQYLERKENKMTEMTKERVEPKVFTEGATDKEHSSDRQVPIHYRRSSRTRLSMYLKKKCKSNHTIFFFLIINWVFMTLVISKE